MTNKKRSNNKKPKLKKVEIETNPAGSLSCDRPDYNQQQYLTVVPEYLKTDPKALIEPSPYGHEGEYEVTFVLGIPGNNGFRDNLLLEKIIDSGTSLILMHGEVAILTINIFRERNNIEAQIDFSKNSEGLLSTAKIKVMARAFLEASQLSHDIVLPMLSLWSFQYDISIDINSYQIKETSTGSTQWSLGMIGKIKPFDLVKFDMDNSYTSKPHNRRLLSIYREAMNAIHPFHQILGFYKVIEGIGILNSERYKDDKDTGLSSDSEKFPKSLNELTDVEEGLKELFQPYLGKKYSYVRHTLRELARNAVAHLDPRDTTNTLNADNFDDLQNCLKAIPVLRYIARKMLLKEITLS